MYRINLLKVKEKIPNVGETEFDYAQNIETALRSGGIEGMTIGEMKDRMDVLDILELARKKEENHILLTEDQLRVVTAAVSKLRFRVATRSAIEFLEHIEHAPKE